MFEARQEQAGNVTLLIAESHGDYSGKPANRSLEVTVNLADEAAVSVTRNGLRQVNLKPAEGLWAGSEGWRYDEQRHAVKVKVIQPSASPSIVVIALGN